MPDPEIRPALTPEEWKRFGFDHGAVSAERFRDLFLGKPTGNLGVQIKPGLWATETPRECHALAALCLYGQPFGFTAEDVADVEWAAKSLHHFGLTRIADKLRALTPSPP